MGVRGVFFYSLETTNTIKAPKKDKVHGFNTLAWEYIGIMLAFATGQILNFEVAILIRN